MIQALFFSCQKIWNNIRKKVKKKNFGNKFHYDPTRKHEKTQHSRCIWFWSWSFSYRKKHSSEENIQVLESPDYVSKFFWGCFFITEAKSTRAWHSNDTINGKIQKSITNIWYKLDKKVEQPMIKWSEKDILLVLKCNLSSTFTELQYCQLQKTTLKCFFKGHNKKSNCFS